MRSFLLSAWLGLLGGCVGTGSETPGDTSETGTCEESPDPGHSLPESCCDGLDGDGDGETDEGAPGAEQCFYFEPLGTVQCIPGPWVCGDASAPGVCMPPLMNQETCDELRGG